MSLLSIVVPCYNEAGNLRELHRRLGEVCSQLDEDYEIILVDDGSRDRSVELMRELREADAHVRVVALARNFGHQAALTAGLDHARGDAVMQLDADLQHPPGLIPRFVEKWREGYDVVYGYRKDAKPRLGYRVLNWLMQVQIPAESADFRLMDRRVVDVLCEMPERARFLRGMIAWLGFKQTGIAYRDDARFAGARTYTARQTLRLGLHGVLAFSNAPLRLAAVLGLVTLTLGLVYAGYILYAYSVRGIEQPGWTGTMMAILILGGVQLLCLGVMAEYIGRIFEEVKRRPIYVVRERLGFEPGRADTDAGRPENRALAEAESPPQSS